MIFFILGLELSERIFDVAYLDVVVVLEELFEESSEVNEMQDVKFL